MFDSSAAKAVEGEFFFSNTEKPSIKSIAKFLNNFKFSLILHLVVDRMMNVNVHDKT